jgi:L-ascorbate oxidase
LEFSIGDVVEFVVVDKGFTFQSNHPMHLHGHSFAVLAVNKLNTSINLADVISMDKNGLLQRNLDKPVIKDTVTVPVGGKSFFIFLLLIHASNIFN